MEFNVDRGAVQTFTFRFALPADFQSRSVSQAVDSLSARFEPQPSSSSVEQDRFGNRFQKVVWNNTAKDIRINLNYNATINSELSAMESRTPFPIGQVPAGDALYLQATDMVQSGAPRIVELGRRLTTGAKNEYEAVTAITNHVADAVKYTFNPPQYDALYTLETKSGNCQNFAHLSIALLRSVGIPARIVGGITLKDAWKVPIDARNSIVQSMGQGGHAWMEVYFPDLGWLPYDPQQSRQFTSSRHIKQTHGLDSRDINDSWRGAPYLPRYSELIEGSFTADDVKLKVKTSSKDPRPYIISNLVAAKAAAPADPGAGLDPAATLETQETEQFAREKAERERMARERAEEERLKNERLKAEQLARQKAEEERKAQEKSERERIARERAEAERQAKLKADEERRARERNEKERIARQKAEADRVAREKAAAEKRAREAAEKARLEALKKKSPAPGAPQLFGNMEFPNLVDSFSVKGDTGTRILDKETSEYVTSHYIYAQAFTVKDAMSLDKVSLAMRKFGGDGSVYVDLVRDSDGKPNILDGVRSDLVSLEKITRKPGYYWVDFGFPKDAQSRLRPGKYWIVLRSSGDAIMNWYYIPGKPYGDSDDTRSTAKGFQWEDILNYDFVFRISGKTL
ncbi:MAG TPA: transglutaminase domain-containing protein, partial [Desulfuromonadaceae bacterium]